MKLSAIVKATVVSSLIVGAVGIANAKTVCKNTVFKDMPCYCPALKDGFYLGAQAGYDAFRVHQGFSDPDSTFSMTGSLTGWTGGLFAGYGQYFQNFYLAGEVFGNYNGNNQTLMAVGDNDGDSFSQKAKAEGTFGISLLPGIRLQDTILGYLRLGYNWTKFSSSFTSVDGGDASTTSLSKNTTQGGFDAGIGMEALIMCNWSVRTEYNHVWYSSTNLINPPIGSANTNISDNQFTLGLVYHFA